MRLHLHNRHAWRRVLWIYTGKRNFGDAIMDLSGRALLRETSFEMDLFTLPHLKALFDEDDVFHDVFADLRDLDGREYDAIVMSEFNLPSIRFKIRHFRHHPFACLFGFFFGPDRNQTHFSHAAINDVFELGYSPEHIAARCKPYLTASTATHEVVRNLRPNTDYMVIGVGGIDANRTYERWADVLEIIDRANHPALPREIVLLGSENGTGAATAILERSFRRLRVHAFVATLSLLQSRDLIAHAGLFVGADGGLMHVAHSTPTPSVSLFSNREPAHLRLTQACRSVSIQSEGDVSRIDAWRVFDAIKRHWCGLASAA